MKKQLAELIQDIDKALDGIVNTVNQTEITNSVLDINASMILIQNLVKMGKVSKKELEKIKHIPSMF